VKDQVKDRKNLGNEEKRNHWLKKSCALCKMAGSKLSVKPVCRKPPLQYGFLLYLLELVSPSQPKTEKKAFIPTNPNATTKSFRLFSLGLPKKLLPPFLKYKMF
jgi:hypothetical protein